MNLYNIVADKKLSFGGAEVDQFRKRLYYLTLIADSTPKG
jgi:hypothetical protein